MNLNELDFTCKSDLLAAGNASVLLLFGIFVTVLVIVLTAGSSTVGTFVWKWFLKTRESWILLLLLIYKESFRHQQQPIFIDLWQAVPTTWVWVAWETLWGFLWRGIWILSGKRNALLFAVLIVIFGHFLQSFALWILVFAFHRLDGHRGCFSTVDLVLIEDDNRKFTTSIEIVFLFCFCQRSLRKFQVIADNNFNLHLYRLMMIDYCGVAPLAELCCDRHVLVWIDYSVMEQSRQCWGWWFVWSCLRDLRRKLVCYWPEAVSFFLTRPEYTNFLFFISQLVVIWTFYLKTHWT